MNRNVLKIFGRHLHKLRTERNLSQLELAYRGDFDRNYIGMIERGERNPSLLNLIRLAKALEISLSELVSFQAE
jgi:transcriptional regulator with XRE-family HTH domain